MPGEKQKITKTVVQLRTDEILRIRLDGAEFWDLRQYVAEQEKVKGSPWELAEGESSLSDRQLRRYAALADKLIADSCRTSRKHLLRRHLAQRRNLFAKAVNSGDIRTALSVLSDEARLLNLYETFPDRKATKEESAPMATADVVKVLSERLRQIESTALPIGEKSRLTTAVADALLSARNAEVLEKQLAELLERVSKIQGARRKVN